MKKLVIKHVVTICTVAGTLSLLGVDARSQWVNTNGPFAGTVSCFATSGTKLFAGLGALFTGPGAGVSLTTDNGAEWTDMSDGLTNMNVWSLSMIGTSIFAGTYKGGVFRSTNNGTTWTEVNTGLNGLDVGPLAVIGSTLFAGDQSGAGVSRSTNNGATWSTANGSTTWNTCAVNALASSGSTLYAGTGYGVGGVLRSTNNGTSWTRVNNGLTDNYIMSLAAGGATVYAGTDGGGVFRSTDNGANWTAVNTGIKAMSIFDIVMSGTDVFVCNAEGVYFSTNGGGNWTAVNDGFTGFTDGVGPLAVVGTTLYASTSIGVWSRPLSEFVASGVAATVNAPSVLQISPNPTHGIVTMRGAGQGTLHVTITNFIGQQVMAFTPSNSSEFSVDLSALHRGAYVARITGSSGSTTKMIIRN
jgi:hypothetical protein